MIILFQRFLPPLQAASILSTLHCITRFVHFSRFPLHTLSASFIPSLRIFGNLPLRYSNASFLRSYIHSAKSLANALGSAIASPFGLSGAPPVRLCAEKNTLARASQVPLRSTLARAIPPAVVGTPPSRATFVFSAVSLMRCRSCLPFAPKPLQRCSATLHNLFEWGQIGTCVKARPACRLRLRFCHGFRGSAIATQQKHTPEAWRYRARSQPRSTTFHALLLSPLVSARRGLAGRLVSVFFSLSLQSNSNCATPFPLCVGNAT